MARKEEQDVITIHSDFPNEIDVFNHCFMQGDGIFSNFGWKGSQFNMIDTNPNLQEIDWSKSIS